MIIRHLNKVPKISQTAWVAPNAVICGDVTIGDHVRVMFGAQVIAENSSIAIGNRSIILENAVIRGTENHPVTIGNNCLIGPGAHVAGCHIEDNVFIATGASVFHGARVKQAAEVRVNAVVHLSTVVPEHTTIPINWVAVGDPMKIFSPEDHEQIWQIQRQYNFPTSVYGIDRPYENESKMPEICKVMSERLKSHFDDEPIAD